MASKIKVDEIEGSTGTTITLNHDVAMASGKTLPAASLTGALPAISGASLTGITTDMTPIRQDINTLALHSAVTDNKAAYNLTDSFIDQFEDDTGIGSTSTCSRTNDEFVGSVYTVQNYNMEMQAWNSDATIVTGSWTGATTNDSLSGGTGVGFADYPCGYPNYIYDLSQDWKIRLFCANRSTGDMSNPENYMCYTGLVTSDTSIAAGADTASAGTDGRVWRATDTRSGNQGNYWANSVSKFANVLSPACVTAWNTGSSNHTQASGNVGHQQVNCSGGNTPWSVSTYWYQASVLGWEVLYDRNAATITIKNATNAGFTTWGTTYATFSSVPTTGRFILWVGCGGQQGSPANSNYWSTTYNGVADADKGYVMDAVNNATGTVTGIANVPTTTNQTEVSGVMLYKDQAGTNTIGGGSYDLKIEFTCDGGSNWTEAAGYTAVTPLFSTGVKMVKLAKTTCTAGNDVRYRAVFANQASTTKEARLYGIALNY